MASSKDYLEFIFLPEKVKAELNNFLDSYVMECLLRRDINDDKKSRKRGWWKGLSRGILCFSRKISKAKRMIKP